eukprot:CAMPEP_0115490682 /NCGR_PEP_ID=MMETSP0271-20121206/62696_1 /TAXON_ID=71861 /ORGANISM="Scrippsiella trochoidea, Strain CCMP3099" /LENGTH=175 /DNA_ID=CAMNT_0002918969 /DNA_START=42 /DNA_END=566 /DNA_ORIENTATION=+
MKLFGFAASIALLSLAVDASKLRAQRLQQEPDTACGKGFDNLVKGSQDYYRTAAVELWTHPSHTMDNATFEAEFECWFASMCTTKCGGLPSLASTRKGKLTEQCKNVQADWLKIWNMFTEEEVKWFKGNYPAEEVAATEEEAVEESTVHYKQAMQTAKEINKKELLCLTLFTIDD